MVTREGRLFCTPDRRAPTYRCNAVRLCMDTYIPLRWACGGSLTASDRQRHAHWKPETDAPQTSRTISWSTP